MCAVCGQPVDVDSEESASLSVMHSSAAVKVSAEEAQRLDSESTSHLLSQRKLALIVDLDQTVIHATVDPTVGEWMRDSTNPNYHALQSVGKFRLGIDGEEISDQDADAAKASRACWYYVKPRPGVPEVLKRLSEKYQLHVYTMGTRSYANCVCKLIDPDASIFGNRILSRDENGSLVRKSLSRLFPVDHSMVVIIDDREDVWSRSPNLLPVLPYEFFVGIGDINATFLPTPPPPPGALPGTKAAEPSGKSDDAAGATAGAAASTKASGAEPGSSRNGSASPTTPEKAVEDAVQKAEAEGRTEEELQAVREAAAHFVAQTEKLQSKLAEQREARPLAKMQEALDEKLGRQSNGASRSGTATPNGHGDSPAGQSSGADSSSSGSESPTGDERSADAITATAPSDDQSEETTTPPTSPSSSNTSLPPLPPPPPPLPPHRSHAVLVDDDNELDRVQSILEDLHAQWYTAHDSMQSPSTLQKPSVVDLIGARKAKVLANCTIVFSSMIPFGHDPEKSDLWAMAREFGATPASEIEPGKTTHVVAARPGTAKVHQALRMGGQLEVVWPSWFHVSASRWARQDEGLYRISMAENTVASAGAVKAGAVEGQKEKQEVVEQAKVEEVAEGEKQEETLFENELNDMDWSAAADEVDAYLDSATTASNTSSPSPSMLAADDVVDIDDAEIPADGGKRKRRLTDDLQATDFAQLDKKQRSEENEPDEEDDDDADDGFLDDLAEELDGQLDNE
ncbi:potential RNA Pol II CTD phosphatase component [Pseudozyma hubeiensis SY62]|uniref:RNA polymerase II subunit A C-terminal domain phosphatase n=1 Tax=Pseudozyma hubeiensis (strain SY62) TaxID=1305764 RepID=R9PDK0_PSEHS|nr:potential RNA Pol II CTD phosphatase component [Pseudozyma hubeiensis SY62]GAC99307.1 potential RNA Pol II CTD phosphatase component [Pseudozyma hubeiensis SY62]